MIGTLVNIGAVIVGGAVGCLLGKQFPDRLKQTVIAGLGLFTLGYGIQMFLKTQNALIVLGGLLLGGVIGELLHIEDGLQNLGFLLEKRFISTDKKEMNSENSSFVRGFLISSLVFCVGPMAILGSIQDGLTGDSSLLIIKSVLDGFGALAFASSLGVGVLFSIFVILFYQGGLSLLAFQMHSLVSTNMITEMTAVGGLLLVGIAFSSLLEIKKIRVGNFIPALIITPILVVIASLFK